VNLETLSLKKVMSHKPVNDPSAPHFSEIVKPLDQFSLKSKSELFSEMIKGRFDLNINFDMPMEQ
jgi:hypothetical protein